MREERGRRGSIASRTSVAAVFMAASTMRSSVSCIVFRNPLNLVGLPLNRIGPFAYLVVASASSVLIFAFFALPPLLPRSPLPLPLLVGRFRGLLLLRPPPPSSLPPPLLLLLLLLLLLPPPPPPLLLLDDITSALHGSKRGYGRGTADVKRCVYAHLRLTVPLERHPRVLFRPNFCRLTFHSMRPIFEEHCSTSARGS